MSPLLTPAQVADLLGKSTWWVADAARRGDLPGSKVGRTWRFSEADVEAYLNRGSAATSAPAPIRRRAS